MSRRSGRPTVLIGPFSDDPAESVSAVNRAFVGGLATDYRFIASAAKRQFGASRQSRLNIWNGYYLLKHTAIWLFNLLRHRPDIAHYAINAGWALRKGLLFLRIARWFGARTVGHLHSGSFLYYWKTLSHTQQRRARAALSRLDAFVVLSEQWRTDVAATIGVPNSNLHVVNNPIDLQFETAALNFRRDLNGSNPELLAMGVMSRDKGALDLLGACALVTRSGVPFKLHIAGPEREPGILQRLSSEIARNELQPHVEVTGPVMGSGKLDLFRQTTISILPSYYENFPLVLLEAAAAGHAIIATPVGAVPEFFVDGVSALFVQPGNVDQLAQAITRLLSNPAERVLLGENARNMFRSTLTRATIMHSMHQVYQSALNYRGNEAAPARIPSVTA